MEIRPFRQLSEPEKYALEKWRNGGHIDKQDILILIVSALVFLIATLLGIRTIMADPLQATEYDQVATRHRTEERPAWFSEKLQLTADEQATLQEIQGLKDV